MSDDLVPTADLRDLIAGNVQVEVEDPESVRARIIDQVLSAENADELFDLGGSVAAPELIGVPLVLRDVRVLASEIADAGPVYVLLDAARKDTGELVAVNSSAGRLMAQAYRAKQLDLLPIDVQIVEVAKAKPGQSAPLGLTRI